MNLLSKSVNATDVNTMYVQSMGKIFKVTGIFNLDDDANRYLETHKDEGVIAVFGSIVIVASFYNNYMVEQAFKKASML